ncbi:transporter [Marilutibacter alkalisoli]|uniref:Transporter n=1 Tax=Marilutibacter alkalisoli TaxID=2591633 RepID=A0A514BNM9_9GAMM|nr:transporter [Lysobacter alkalisoli]QDH68991.1 transporter [Lysobacter alkalisoli]
MIRSSVFPLTLLVLAAPAAAADGFSLGIGVDYSSGDYGSDTTTDILSIPVTTRVDVGDWSFKASLPWIRVDGDPNVLPSVGLVDNLNPVGRGRGGLIGGPPADDDTSERGSASGIGDLTLSATYAVPTGSALGVDLTAKAKIATADEDKGLGTGANDYGVAVDLYRDFGGTLLFGGVGYTWLGESDFIEVDSVLSGNIGLGWRTGQGRVGLMYDYKEAAASGFDDRSDLVGFFSTPTGEDGRFQVYLSKGLSDGSPDWGVGANFLHSF